MDKSSEIFQHVILTRFNLKTGVWQKDKNRNDILDREWLEERKKMFLQFCLPSVLGQTRKNFKWMIFFEEGSQEQLGEVFEAIEKHPFYCTCIL